MIRKTSAYPQRILLLINQECYNNNEVVSISLRRFIDGTYKMS